MNHRVRGEPQNLQGVADRGQRVAQLVGQGRQELVLAPVGVPQRSFCLGALRDIPDAAPQPQVLPLFSVDGLAGLSDPPSRAVLVNDAELEFDARRGCR